MKTASAIEARRATYSDKDRVNLIHIQGARASGAKNAREIAKFLNNGAVPGPTNATWTESAVLRCIRRLKALGLDEGSLPPAKARRNKGRRPAAVKVKWV